MNSTVTKRTPKIQEWKPRCRVSVRNTSEFPPNCHVFLSICLSFYLLPLLLLLFHCLSLSSHSSRWAPSMELWKAEKGTQFQVVPFPTDRTLHPLSFREIQQFKLSWSPEAQSTVNPLGGKATWLCHSTAAWKLGLVTDILWASLCSLANGKRICSWQCCCVTRIT